MQVNKYGVQTSTTANSGVSPDVLALTQAPAAANLANQPQLEALAKMINDINMAAPGRSQQLTNIQGMMAGNLDPATVQAAQQNAAAQYGARGFGVDSGAWQSAIQRAMGLSRQDLQERGSTALNAMYASMPTVDVQNYMATPALYETHRSNVADEAARAAALREQARQFNLSSTAEESQFVRNLQQRAAESAQAAAQANAELAEKQRQFNESQSYAAAIDLARLQENARQANQQAEIARSELQQGASQFTASQSQQQGQFTSTLQQRQAEAAQDSSRQWASLYAQLYGTLPGYDASGRYTGIVSGATPTAGAAGDAYSRNLANLASLQAQNQARLDLLHSYK